jgi:hypothetical protein
MDLPPAAAFAKELVEAARVAAMSATFWPGASAASPVRPGGAKAKKR